MPFFKDLRRRTASFRSNKSGSPDGTNGSKGSDDTNSTVPETRSSSTLNSVYANSTPPSTIQPHASSSNLATPMPNKGAPIASRPTPVTLSSSRLSMMGSGAPSINGNTSTRIPQSAFAPIITSVSENSWVHQKVLLVQGQIGDPEQQAIDGNLIMNHHQDTFPPTTWPVSDSRFKALVYLNPGRNRLRFDFTSPKLQSSNSSSSAHTIWFNINFLPMTSSPPLQLVILLGKDSPATFDAVPERIRKEGNGLDTAIRKYRMAAYIWQAFTGEQMYRNGFGRRCFRFEEEWQTGSLTARDMESGQMRNEAKVHVVRSDKTVEELRDLDIAQQYEKASRKGDLFTIALNAVKAHFRPLKGQKQYVSVLLLDSHWDTKAKVITSHAALGGRSEDIDLAIFGSQALQSFPACVEDVPYAFTDCTRTDTNHVANDCNESGSNWEAANIGIGAHLHEVGHLFGCPHQESGVMLRDYVRFNRTFICREPYSTRTKSPGLRSWTQDDECNWHRLDVLRFRHHPCFRLPTDLPISSDNSVQIWRIDNGKILVTAQTGIAFMELFTEGEDTCHVWKEFISGDADPRGPPQQVCLAEADIKTMLPEDRRSKKIKLKVHSVGGGDHTVPDYGQLAKSKDSVVKLPNGQPGFLGSKLGFSQQTGTRSEQIILHSAIKQTVVLRSIKVYHGFALDGIEFCYENSTSQLFGKKGGQPGGSEFQFDTRKSETLMGFYLRAGLWVDGIEILTSLGRRSGVYGNAKGGSGHTLIPPRGYSIAGVSGTCGQWIDGFSLIIAR